jgi:hypothetical protein
MSRIIFVILGVAALLPAAAAHAQAQTQLMSESRETAASLLQQLSAKLRATLTDNGPEGSVPVCKNIAPELAGKLSRETGWRVARVSLRTRNPLLGTPDAWEQRVLEEFDRRAANGDKPESIEFGEVVNEPAGRYFRYLKAIPVSPLCVTCHGPRDQLSPFIQAQLHAEYPHDKAVGYSPGQLRGAVTIKRPLD